LTAPDTMRLWSIRPCNRYAGRTTQTKVRGRCGPSRACRFGADLISWAWRDGMKIHHLSCGSMCPLGGRLMDGVGDLLHPATLVCHCLLIETEQGLVLVDTGLGLQDVVHPHERLNEVFRTTMRVQLHEEETAIAQIRRLGFDPADVRHIVLTHLDFDHAGGIEDFPQAKVHVYGEELRAAQQRDTLIAKGRYRPQQWDEDVDWRLYEDRGEPWFGFDSIRNLEGLPPEILLIPLIGHTWGHCGVAVDTD